jgi:hypothetical protein
MKRITKIAPKNLLPGFYMFRVIEVGAETDAKKGHDLLKVKLAAVNLEDNSKGAAFDRFPFTEEMSWKIGSFLVSLGFQVREDNSVDWDDAQLVGKGGYLLSVENTVGDKKYVNYQYLAPDDDRFAPFTEEEDPTPTEPTATAAPAPVPEPEAQPERTSAPPTVTRGSTLKDHLLQKKLRDQKA